MRYAIYCKAVGKSKYRVVAYRSNHDDAELRLRQLRAYYPYNEYRIEPVDP